MREAQRLQTNAVEMATLLTLPASAALAICAPAFVTAFFVGGKMTQVNGAIMADIVIALVAGLPSYVLVKVFQPAFFSRERSEERRVGKECVSTCRSRWSPSHSKKK